MNVRDQEGINRLSENKPELQVGPPIKEEIKRRKDDRKDTKLDSLRNYNRTLQSVLFSLNKVIFFMLSETLFSSQFPVYNRTSLSPSYFFKFLFYEFPFSLLRTYC